MNEAAVIGRVGADFYPNQVETPLERVRTYTRFVGGFAGNVATGLARLGVPTAIVSRVGAEGHGTFVREFLAAEGVDVGALVTDPVWPTPPTFCEVWPPDRFPITYYRHPTAPDWQLSLADLDVEALSRVPLLYASGTSLAQSPARETVLELLRRHRGRTVFDLDWRPVLWEDPDEFPRLARRAIAAADVVVGNEEEVVTALAGRQPPARSAASLVVKRGERGVTVHTGGRSTDVPAHPVEVINGLGAGDAFAAALGHGLLRGMDLVAAARHGAVAGAIVASRMACSEAMPTLEELERESEEALL